MIANREPRKVGTACFGAAEPSYWTARIVDDEGRDVADGPARRAAGALPRPGSAPRFLSRVPEGRGRDRGGLAGGWFHTGDVVRRDAEGDLHFVDRKKNVIRRSGENISAVEVESVLLQHPAVLSAGVAGVPDEMRGDEVMACIVLRERPRAPMSARLAREMHCGSALERLAYFKAPGYVAFVDALPLDAPRRRSSAARLQRAGRAAAGDTPRCVDLRAFKKRTRCPHEQRATASLRRRCRGGARHGAVCALL